MTMQELVVKLLFCDCLLCVCALGVLSVYHLNLYCASAAHPVYTCIRMHLLICWFEIFELEAMGLTDPGALTDLFSENHLQPMNMNSLATVY
jgi:hypothetical protein